MSKLLSTDNEEASLISRAELDKNLSRKFGKGRRLIDPVVYEFTNDRALLHQYYRIRELMYRKVFKTDRFMGEEDVHDKLSHILIARRGKLCVGGCRLTIREADEDFMLPMETSDFRLRNVLPDHPFKKIRHGEISRFAIIDEDEDKMGVMMALSQLIIEKSIDAELGYVYVKSSLPMARNWRKIGQSCGLRKSRICTEIKVPENPIHPEITWYISEVILPAAERMATDAKEISNFQLLEDSAVH